MTQSTALTKTVEQQVTTRFGSLIRADKRQLELEKAKALVLAGFDPVLHLTIYEDSLWVLKAGYNWWLRRRDHHPNARISSEPIIGEALRAAYGLKEDEIGVLASIYLPGQNEPVVKGFGKASTRPYTYERPPDNATPAQKTAARQHPDRRRNPIEAPHPYDMAEIRAERKAVFKLVPLGGYVPDEGPSEPTGTIIEGESRVMDEPTRSEPIPAGATKIVGGDPLTIFGGQYEDAIPKATTQEELQRISYALTEDAALTQEEKTALRRLIGQRSQELRG